MDHTKGLPSFTLGQDLRRETCYTCGGMLVKGASIQRKGNQTRERDKVASQSLEKIDI